MEQTDLPPAIIAQSRVACGTFEIIEWHWPPMVSFSRTETQLMLEMSLPPMAADASACFPEIDPERRFFMGTLFIRHPGILVAGRSEGRQIRVVRLVFDDEATRTITGGRLPPLAVLQGLLNIRSQDLRNLMRLVHRELINPAGASQPALEALTTLVRIETERLFEHPETLNAPSRLAPWQFRRIRERIESGSPAPDVADLAALCGISVRHLHRQFIALTGKPISAYIETYRVEQAKHMLMDPAIPVKQVAVNAGFQYPNSFARAFRRVTGLSPREFRQRSASRNTVPPRILDTLGVHG